MVKLARLGTKRIWRAFPRLFSCLHYHLAKCPTSITPTPRIPISHSRTGGEYLVPIEGGRMNQPRLSRCIKYAFSHSKYLHTGSSSTPSSIAHLLDRGPAEPENVVVNGFIRSIRNQKTRSFASLGDGSSLEPLQALLTPAQAHRSELSPSFLMRDMQNTETDQSPG